MQKPKRIRLIRDQAWWKKGEKGWLWDGTNGIKFDRENGGHDLGVYGAKCKKGHGYYISDDSFIFILESEATMNNAKYGVKYDRNGDPVEFFKTKKEAQKRIEQLLDDSEVDKASIYFFELGKVFEVKRPVSYELVQV